MNRITKIIATMLIIIALFVNASVYAQSKDIQGHWSEDIISKMQEEGLISGYADGTFRPNKPITRAEFVAALNKILGFTDSSKINFKDVKPTDWFAKELAIAVHYGYIKGYSDGTFRPHHPVTRFEVAIMISRANKLSERFEANDNELQVFQDRGSIPNWVKADLALIVKSGIMKGNLHFFQGQNHITRAEAVVALSRAKNVKEHFVAADKKREEKQKKDTAKLEVAQKNDKKSEKQADKKTDRKADKKAGEDNGNQTAAQNASGAGVGSVASGYATSGSTASGSTVSGSTTSDSSASGSVSEGSAATVGAGGAMSANTASASADAVTSSGGSNTAAAGSDGSAVASVSAGTDASAGVSVSSGASTSVGNSSASTSGGNSNSVGAAGSEAASGSSVGTDSNTADSNGTLQDSNAQQDPSAQQGSNTQQDSQDPATQPQETQKRYASVEDLVASLRSAQNSSVSTYKWDNEDRAVLWVKGIEYPDLNSFRKGTIPSIPEWNLVYQPNMKWYDVDKEEDASKLLCSAAVSSNMLHWWLEQNRANVQKFMTKNTGRLSSYDELLDSKEPEALQDPTESEQLKEAKLLNSYKKLETFLDSFTSETQSEIFNMWTKYFSHTNGVWADTVTDLFINGYTPKIGAVNDPANTSADFTPDNRGGFFHSVFGKHILTERVPEGSNGSPIKASYDLVNTTIKQWLKDGKVLGISLMTKRFEGHIYTIWGAEFDLDGNIQAVFISDSDDAGSRAGMKRVSLVKDRHGNVKISNNLSSEEVPRVLDIYSLSLGTELWEAYFEVEFTGD